MDVCVRDLGDRAALLYSVGYHGRERQMNRKVLPERALKTGRMGREARLRDRRNGGGARGREREDTDVA